MRQRGSKTEKEREVNKWRNDLETMRQRERETEKDREREGERERGREREKNVKMEK
jgi:hypothetical protein